MMKKMALAVICSVGLHSSFARDYRIDYAENENQAYEYVAQRLGVYGKHVSFVQRLSSLLDDYNVPISLFAGLFVGVPLGGLVAPGLKGDCFGGLAVAGGMHMGLTLLAKKYADTQSFHRDRLTDFIKEWETHKDNVPADFYVFFKRLYDDYQASEGMLVCSNRMIQEFYHLFAQRLIELHIADVEYVIN